MRAAAWIPLAGLIGAAAVSAQQQGPNDPAAAARRSFNEVAGWVVAAAEKVPAEKYNYRPVETVRTFGQIVGHVADGLNWYCAAAGGKPQQWSDPVEKGVTGKAALIEKLKASVSACNAVYAKPVQWNPLIENVGHTSLHYGNIVTYMRGLGLVPPSS
jgi:uncharacterized damage-inducible protein DinB